MPGKKALVQIFSEVPETYELVNHILTFGLDILWRKKAARMASLESGNVWLDVCTGTGETASYLRKLLPAESTVIALDFCPAMLKKARLKPQGKEMKFLLGETANLPFRDSSIDVVTISFATRNINVSRDHLLQSLREFHRVLKPGGLFVNLETSQPENVLVRTLFHRYVGLVVKRIGAAVSGSRKGYSYLSNTIPRFYDRASFSSLIVEAGFSHVRATPLFLGVAAIHRAKK